MKGPKMVRKIDMDKKRFTEAEARYLVDRPWLTTSDQRKGLQRMLAKKEEKSQAHQSNQGDDTENNQE